MAEKPHGDKKEHGKGKDGGHGKEGGHDKPHSGKKPAPKSSGKAGFIGFIVFLLAVAYSIYLQIAQAPQGSSPSSVFFGRIFGSPGSTGNQTQ